MKKYLLFIIALTMLLNLSIFTAKADDTCLYVSAAGDDQSNGSISAPLKTLEKAIDVAKERQIKTIYIRGGVYQRTDTLELNQIKDLTLQAYENETVIFSGAITIPKADFQPVEDIQILSRLSSEARNQVKYVNLADYGMTEYPELSYSDATGILPWQQRQIPASELFFDGEAMNIARSPNDGWDLLGEVLDPGANPRAWMDDYIGQPEWVPPEDRDQNHGFTFRVQRDNLELWKQEKDIRLWGFWYYDWYDQIVGVKSIDAENGIVTTAQPSMYTAKTGARYFVYNLLCELDVQGEYYLDRENGNLYVYFPDSDSDTVSYSVLDKPFISVNACENVTICGIQMECSRSQGFVIAESSSGTLISNCDFRLLAGNAVDIAGKSNGIENSYIENTNGGINLSGGNRQTLEAGNNFVRNCELYKFSRLSRTYNSAVNISGVGNIVSNNKIHYSTHQAIGFGGNDHIIENNEIYDVLLETDDAGAIYAGRNNTMRGTIIRNNFIHHTGARSPYGKTVGSTGCMGIYLDDGFCGTTIENNLFYEVDIPVVLNGGRDNIVQNNLMLNTTQDVILSDIFYSSISDGTWELNGNGLYVDGTKMPAVPFDGDVYTKYPNMNNILSDEPRKPKYNLVKNNLSGNQQVLTCSLRELMEEEVLQNNNCEKQAQTIIDENCFLSVDLGVFVPKDFVYNRNSNISDFRFDNIGTYDNPCLVSISLDYPRTENEMHSGRYSHLASGLETVKIHGLADRQYTLRAYLKLPKNSPNDKDIFANEIIYKDRWTPVYINFTGCETTLDFGNSQFLIDDVSYAPFDLGTVTIQGKSILDCNEDAQYTAEKFNLFYQPIPIQNITWKLCCEDCSITSDGVANICHDTTLICVADGREYSKNIFVNTDCLIQLDCSNTEGWYLSEDYLLEPYDKESYKGETCLKTTLKTSNPAASSNYSMPSLSVGKQYIVRAYMKLPKNTAKQSADGVVIYPIGAENYQSVSAEINQNSWTAVYTVFTATESAPSSLGFVIWGMGENDEFLIDEVTVSELKIADAQIQGKEILKEQGVYDYRLLLKNQYGNSLGTGQVSMEWSENCQNGTIHMFSEEAKKINISCTIVCNGLSRSIQLPVFYIPVGNQTKILDHYLVNATSSPIFIQTISANYENDRLTECLVNPYMEVTPYYIYELNLLEGYDKTFIWEENLKPLQEEYTG